ncbi:acyl-CoA dehydrogenase family protein [Ideonella sp. B508-1]|uniref:acyl-CoA dehydrogenase family protein n=1 Tax=Ideonella sp. B508-1 TaxID=137716 RepID=UPI0003486DD0|nr:acyl-CoA dehydrogenase family protein [Ideonella sp. B508-1]
MNFILTEEQQMLADTVARFVQTEYDFEARRRRLAAAAGAAPGYDEGLLGQLAELGLFALNVPEAWGGIGAGPVETMIVMEGLGRGLVVEPFLASGVIAPRLIATHGSPAQKDRFLPGIATGELRFAVAALEPQSRFDLDEIATTARRAEGHWIVDGAKSVVMNGDSAHWFIVTAQSEAGPLLLLIDAQADGVTAAGFPTLDGRRAAELRFAGVRVADDCMLGAPGQGLALADWAIDQGLAGLAAEAVGAMGRLTELTCEYIATRKQFGQAIGSFQALQHRAADMRINVEQARALALMAAARVDSADAADRRRAASAAKAMAGRAGRYVGQQATQLHGGMGMTDEMACGHYFKRLTAIDMTWGDSEHHVERYGELL